MNNTAATKGNEMQKPDRTMKLSECKGLLLVIARAHVERHGFYTFTDIDTMQRVKVVA